VKPQPCKHNNYGSCPLCFLDSAEITPAPPKRQKTIAKDHYVGCYKHADHGKCQPTCARGHERSEANTQVSYDGRTGTTKISCKICKRLTTQARRDKQRQSGGRVE
jgi:hypothetical protein